MCKTHIACPKCGSPFEHTHTHMQCRYHSGSIPAIRPLFWMSIDLGAGWRAIRNGASIQRFENQRSLFRILWFCYHFRERVRFVWLAKSDSKERNQVSLFHHLKMTGSKLLKALFAAITSIICTTNLVGFPADLFAGTVQPVWFENGVAEAFVSSNNNLLQQKI